MRREQLRKLRGYTLLFGLGLVAVGVLITRTPADTPGRWLWPWLLGGGLVLAGAVVVGWWQRTVSSSGRVARRSRRALKHDGQATGPMIWRTAGRHAMRKQLKILRPHLAARLSWWQRLRTPTTEVASRTARVGVWWIYVAIEYVTLLLGGPRMGKTGALACRILDAPGAVIATSTRTDLIELTASVREERNGPTYVFNPAGIGDILTTVSFDPLHGCEDGPTADNRAGDLLQGTTGPGADGGDRQFWTTQARRVLGVLMHAAALGGHGMRDVLGWVAAPDDAAATVIKLARRSEDPSHEADARQFFNTNDRTRSSICATIMPALGWLTNPTAVATTTGDHLLDVEALLAERGTVYLLATKEHHQIVPLNTAFTAHVAREARRLAGGARLDPPLLLGLDEVAVTCPVPLDDWTADMGGRNITIVAAAQSRSQLRQRYGPDGAAAILNNAATLLIFGGGKDETDLEAHSKLTGERDEPTVSYDHDGHVSSRSTRRVPVLSPAQIAQLPPHQAVVITRGLLTCVGKAPMAWKRRDVKHHRRLRARATKPESRLHTAWRRWLVQLEAGRAEQHARRAWTTRLAAQLPTPDSAGEEST